MARTGRPLKLTSKVQAAILTALRSGVKRKDAAIYAGVSYDTLVRWLKRGSSPRAKEQLREFYRAVTRTEATVKIRACGFVQRAMDGDWRAASWWLERVHHEEFGKKDSTHVTTEELHAGDEQAVDFVLQRDRLRQLGLKALTAEYLDTVEAQFGRAPVPTNGGSPDTN